MSEQLLVGVVVRAHGIRGEVVVEPRTDVPGRRFLPGQALARDPEAGGPLVVTAARPHSGKLLVLFDGVADRTAAESLRGVRLLVDAGEAGPALDAGETGEDVWWDRQLIGLAALLPDGSPLGEVADVSHAPGNDLLVVRTEEGREVLIPFVAALVPEVDVAAGRLVVDPPPGLLDL